MKSGNTITVYILAKMTDISSTLNINPVYAPLHSYAILSLREDAGSYSEIGSLWITNNGTGTLYGDMVAGTKIYITGTYVAKSHS